MSIESPIEHRGDTQRRLLETLQRFPAGRSVESLTADLGVTANAVRQHLTALERDGLVCHEAVPAPRGRPQFLYQLTQQGQEIFPRRYRELAVAVLAELAETLGPEALDRAMRRMGEHAAEAAGLAGVSVPVTGRVMQQLGYDAKARSSTESGEEIVARNCVFHKVAERYPAVCQFDLGFMEAATGRGVEHRECMVRGNSVCRFAFVGPRKSESIK
jgi:predicted ArsR family transcriptional regulator